tara:strand:+ start:1027 stop:1392 length:366 start_codon:yes stop_codon:yes gene_type:complete
MTDADTQQRQAGMQAEGWARAFLYRMRKDNNNLRDEPIDMDAFDDKIEFSEQVFSAKLIAAGLDEVAMSLRMIAERMVDSSSLDSSASMVASSLDGIAEKLNTDKGEDYSLKKEPFKPTKY